MMTRGLGLALAVVGAALLAIGGRTVIAQGQANCCPEPYAEAQVAGSPRLRLELAVTPEERARGLMFRTELPADQGMLFVFEQETSGAFWNMNTLIPLSIAYIAADGRIVDIQDMRPIQQGQQPDYYPPAAAYRYALEVNQGWYANNGVTVGDVMAFCLHSP